MAISISKVDNTFYNNFYTEAKITCDALKHSSHNAQLSPLKYSAIKLKKLLLRIRVVINLAQEMTRQSFHRILHNSDQTS